MPNTNVNGAASGIALPFAPSGAGGVRTLVGDELILQYVQVYAADCQSDNPYQEMGIGLEAVFQNGSDTAWKGQIRRAMEQMFKLYLERSNLAKLKSITFTQDKEGEQTMNIVFISIESNEELAVAAPLSRAESSNG